MFKTILILLLALSFAGKLYHYVANSIEIELFYVSACMKSRFKLSICYISLTQMIEHNVKLSIPSTLSKAINIKALLSRSILSIIY